MLVLTLLLADDSFPRAIRSVPNFPSSSPRNFFPTDIRKACGLLRTHLPKPFWEKPRSKEYRNPNNADSRATPRKPPFGDAMADSVDDVIYDYDQSPDELLRPFKSRLARWLPRRKIISEIEERRRLL